MSWLGDLPEDKFKVVRVSAILGVLAAFQIVSGIGWLWLTGAIVGAYAGWKLGGYSLKTALKYGVGIYAGVSLVLALLLKIIAAIF